MMTVFSPSQALCSAMTWAWVQMSWVKQDNCKTKFIKSIFSHLWRQLWQLVRLGVDPAKGLQFGEILVAAI